MKRYFFLLGICLFTTSCCGYRFSSSSLNKYESISIPLAKNDLHGTFTTALAQKIKEKSTIKLSLCHSDLHLRIELSEWSEENVDYRYAEKENKPLSRFVVPVGARLQRTAIIELLDISQGCRLLGPYTVTSYLTYDFQSDFVRREVHAFSLSQLEMHEIAQEEALKRLDQLLAEKVVDSLLYCW